jgi:cyclopropane-fatty-acyl-phospholipid synthase
MRASWEKARSRRLRYFNAAQPSDSHNEPSARHGPHHAVRLLRERKDYPMADSTAPARIDEPINPKPDAPAPPGPVLELIEGTGVRINGGNPCDVQVHDPETYRRILARGSRGFGEAYMDGLWDCPQLDAMFTSLLRADIEGRIGVLRRRVGSLLRAGMSGAARRLLNRQSKRRAYQVGERHYDLGNDLFEAMLDPTLSYSCGYWAHARNLEQAQRDKLDMICRKLELRPGEHLLDIGCGWGGLARHAAEHYAVKVFGITVSRQQLALARARCANLPVTLALMDYRELEGRYDKIASVGMFEHVGPKNYRVFFDTVCRLLKDQGLFLLHTIGTTTPGGGGSDPWMDRYIFPNGALPSAKQIAAAVESKLLIRDWHEFGADYDRTLMAWWYNFSRAWPALRDRYGPRFYRMWKYYLHVSAAGFRAGQTQLWQIMLTHPGARLAYRSIRP